jgi:sugar lactone lactonase YvrE
MPTLNFELVAEDFIFLEAPRWHDGALWVTDVFDSKIYRIDLRGEKTVALANLPPRPSSLGFLRDGSMLVVSSVNRQLLRFHLGNVEIYADLSKFVEGDVNDFTIDSDDRVYIGNFGYDLFGGELARQTVLCAIEPDRRVHVVATGLEFPNGTAIINQGRTLVVAESWRGRLTAFDRAMDGALSNGRIFAHLPGKNPDGICADAQGAIWTPSFNTGELLRVLDGGEITHSVQFEGSAVAAQVGGPDGRTLFCTTYAGTNEQSLAGERRGKVFAARLDYL